MRILTFSTLYPNSAMPHHGIFVENRLRHLIASGVVQAHVVAPVPWFPTSSPVFGRYATFARVPRREERFGIAVEHPRFLVPPKFGLPFAPFALFAAGRREAERIRRMGWDFDLIDAHYFYPDGVAAVMLARSLGRPVTVTARGSDLTLFGRRHALPRAMIKSAARKADGLITVSQGLKDELTALGVERTRVHVLRNGVDLSLFRPPADRAAARAALGLSGPTLVAVGQLIARKAHDIAIAGLAGLPGFTLLIVGEGPERQALAALARRMGVADRVRFLGALRHEALPTIYGAADALVLPSLREGWANVLLESMACGTPAIASEIPGTNEVISAPAAGALMRELNSGGLIEAVQRLFLEIGVDRAATRSYAERFGWGETTYGQIDLFQGILAERLHRASAAGRAATAAE